jgi:DNA polymerase-3 subunit alpha
MTALLSVTKNDTAKVALYVVDARRMGVAVEPPDVNASGWDFTTEDKDGQPCCIRFGLGAVKNVGQGAVEAILKTREVGKFKDLNDFIHRVDLRQVGRRALESLIKVGAMDAFGARIALLEAIDRMMSVSAAHFRAADMGQMSLFGAHTGVTEQVTLPKVTSEVSRREILNWERELIGLYVSDHPLSPVMEELTQAVTHFSGQLAEATHQEKVRVAGLITRIRHHQSKAGKPMGFVTIEDLQGAIELVIFPRTWEKVGEIVDYDKIILVDGKVDAEGAEPKVLVDNISTDLKMTVSSNAPAEYPPSGNARGAAAKPGAKSAPKSAGNTPASPSAPKEPAVRDEPSEAWEPDWDGSAPPPPDSFSDDWDDSPAMHSTSFTEMAVAVFAEPLPDLAAAKAVAEPQAVLASSVQGEEPPVVDPFLEPETVISSEVPPLTGLVGLPVAAAVTLPVIPLPAQKETPPPAPEITRSEPPAVLPRYLVSPTPVAGSENIYMITVMVRSSGDKTRDVLRLRRIHGTIMSYPGNDRFALHVYERGRGYLLEFPNFTTGWCPELVSRLHLLVGGENLRIEPITFQ